MKGLIEEESEKKIVEDGNVVIWTTDTARYSKIKGIQRYVFLECTKMLTLYP